MRNLFEYSRCANELDGKEFIVKTIDDDLLIQKRKAESEFSKAKMCIWKSVFIFLVIALIFTMLSMIPFCMFAKRSDNLAQAARENLLLVIISGALFAGAFTFLILFVAKSRKAEFLIDIAEIAVKLPEFKEKGFESLSVPGYASEIEVFGHFFRGKENKRRIPLFYGNFYENKILKLFVQENSLFFSNSEVLVEIAYSDIKSINKISKSILFHRWFKPIHWAHGIYKSYKIRNLDTKCFKTHSFYSIIVDKGYGECEIIIPDYEEETLKVYLDLLKEG